MTATQPPCATKKQLKIQRCEKCGLKLQHNKRHEHESSAQSSETEDSSPKSGGTVYYDDPAATQIAKWTEWPIDLQKFADQGINLANVNTITIGFGDKNNLRAGGSGMVLFDDIRLHRPAPEPEPAP